VPVAKFQFEVAIPTIHEQALSSLQFLHHLRDVVLGDIENDGYRLQLRNDGKAILIACVNNVPRVDGAQADSAVDGRCNPRIGKIQLRALNRTLVSLHNCFVLIDSRGLGIELLFWNGILGE